jgi:hypothetical protein
LRAGRLRRRSEPYFQNIPPQARSAPQKQPNTKNISN